VFKSTLLAAQLSQTERRDLFDHDLSTKSTAIEKIARIQRDVVL
jgi:hypothetical protein